MDLKAPADSRAGLGDERIEQINERNGVVGLISDARAPAPQADEELQTELKKHYEDPAASKISGENALRVIKAVW